MAPSPTHVVPGSRRSSSGATAAGAPSTTANTSRRPASTTGRAPGEPAASASSVETPASRSSSANASARAAARPIRTPVKLPGPVPTTRRLSSLGSAPASSRSSSASASTRTAREARSASTSPSRTSALVAALVAVSKASVSIAGDIRQQLPVVALELDRPVFSVHVRQTYSDADGGECVGGGLGPFDEADRILEVRLQIPPLGRRKALETKEIEVRGVGVSRVAVTNGKGRAGDGSLDSQRPAGAADEGRLAGAELARDGDHVANPQHAGEPRGDRLCLRRRSGHSRKMLPHFPIASASGNARRVAREIRTSRAEPPAREPAWQASAPAPRSRRRVDQASAGNPPPAPSASPACRAPPQGGRAGRGALGDRRGSPPARRRGPA